VKSKTMAKTKKKATRGLKRRSIGDGGDLEDDSGEGRGRGSRRSVTEHAYG